MSITWFGIATILISLLLVLIRPSKLWVLLILTLPFQASAVFEISASDRLTGVNPSYFVMILACGVTLLQLPKYREIPSQIGWCFLPAFLFWLWGSIAAYFVPRLMEDRLVVISYAEGLSYLASSPSNARHSLYLLLSILSSFLLTLAIVRNDATFLPTLSKTLVVSGWLAIAFLVWDAGRLYLGLPFPSDILYSNPGVIQAQGGFLRPELGVFEIIRRPAGTFSESSMAAMYCAGFLALYLERYVSGRSFSKRHVFAAIGISLVLLMVVSSTAIFALVGTVVVFFLIALYSLAFLHRSQRLKRLLLFVVLLAAILALIYLISGGVRREIDDSIRLLTTDRIDYELIDGPRLATEMYALQVFVDTLGFGVGFGSNLSWTIWGYVLGSTGIIGAALLGLFAIRVAGLFKRALYRDPLGDPSRQTLREFAMFGVGLLLTGLVSIPLLLQPVMWITLGLITGASVRLLLRERRPAGLGARTALARRGSIGGFVKTPE